MTIKEWVGKSIVIVDDSKEVRRKVRALCESVGLQVVGEASDGMQAIKQVEEHGPDFVTLDIIMPEMDGIECFQFLKRHHPEIECFFISILCTDIRVIDAYRGRIEAFRFLAKPCDSHALSNALGKIVSHVAEESESATTSQDGADAMHEIPIS